jgi:hypothetical protein
MPQLSSSIFGKISERARPSHALTASSSGQIRKPNILLLAFNNNTMSENVNREKWRNRCKVHQDLKARTQLPIGHHLSSGTGACLASAAHRGVQGLPPADSIFQAPPDNPEHVANCYLLSIMPFADAGIVAHIDIGGTFNSKPDTKSVWIAGEMLSARRCDNNS